MGVSSATDTRWHSPAQFRSPKQVGYTSLAERSDGQSQWLRGVTRILRHGRDTREALPVRVTAPALSYC